LVCKIWWKAKARVPGNARECSPRKLQPNEGKCMRDTMSGTYTAPEDHEDQHDPGLYEIRIRGHLDKKWAVLFEGMTLRLEDNGDTLLTGMVADQAALHGLLRKVRDLGMPLISINSSTHTRTTIPTTIPVTIL
jgi:hypothetical protein